MTPDPLGAGSPYQRLAANRMANTTMVASPLPIDAPTAPAAKIHRPTSPGGVLFVDGHTGSINPAPATAAAKTNARASNLTTHSFFGFGAFSAAAYCAPLRA